ncbi:MULTISPECIES: PstS family phosphate ABC transporter substrate-binding protein [Chryseobacterium]|jgi:phosphate transport system substrate-binding protein|uniref:Phosphate ABC transporter substrate-binding protein n=2 Tax=Chryseobacterium TaxID=59732 RepID=A0ABX9IR66_9FLAO|nr:MULTISPECIES: substrate-binding domain-containing protein [Chryseobacterium]MBL3548758.1 substrate-binding domain-containing protein [Chryseobacterium sp. KMC2]MDC8098365.1 substrate-binding domain-containing protein [Chryseobacterium rhizosphaerae]REC78822.1 phosphate ABC transporter substrate-binding protein [Chryseobacterium rhizosphaerae]SMC54461.1 phosphate transport system substrate-binding protein [Chryseobacterium sp. YR221]
MKNSFKIVVVFILSIMLINCKKEEKSPSYNKGDLTIFTDESFQSVTEALADGYMINYPETRIKVATKKEDLGLLDLLNGKAKVIVMSRNLTTEEVKTYEERTDLKFLPSKFAADAVVFVVPKNSPKESISMEEINEGMLSENKNFIFDGTNSSNLNFVAEKLKKQPKDLKFSIIPGNKKIIEELGQYPDKIGVVGLNTFSRPYDKASEKLREMVKVLPVVQKGKQYTPDFEGLRSMEYPFTRVLYFLANEGNFNIANGFMRFSCTHLGQKIVQKEGLQPYNVYRREVQMR